MRSYKHDDTEALAHYGTKGMHWGDQNSSSLSDRVQMAQSAKNVGKAKAILEESSSDQGEAVTRTYDEVKKKVYEIVYGQK